ncbi:Elongation of very long chain fatty acids protein AAEL008004-like Protein [Tribolium castaneum]|uniref:Elongation of very long chain fatty acids protein n=2 Tax=Tribolium castaneum TaxID=7070 RepID=A0A139WMV2_TRICA|nr:Elongation of very long chain fatty acids protein AAEL008004-like Protein [Tribolium castaneum]
MLDYYNYLIYELEDPLIKNKPLLNSPFPSLAFLATYLLLIYVVLPQYMKNKEPYKLKTIILLYNLFQIVFCTYFVYQYLTPLSDPLVNWNCDYFTYEDTPKSQRRSKICYYVYLIKIAELVETVFFVLRKKYKQISGLHVYHHTSTLLLVWFLTKYYSGGVTAFWFMLNSGVHVLMYTYYLVASLGFQRATNFFKPIMTLIQMIQFIIVMIHGSQIMLNPNCGLPSVVFMVAVPDAVLLFYMFGKFFKATYLRADKKKVK